MARVHIVPIVDVNLSVRTVAEVQHLRSEIARQKEILSMVPDKARALAFQDVLVRALPVDVVHEDRMAIFVRPRAALIDHRTGVRMPAARIARATVSGMRRSANVVPMV